MQETRLATLAARFNRLHAVLVNFVATWGSGSVRARTQSKPHTPPTADRKTLDAGKVVEMPSATTLIVIGATGDLTGRLLLPALTRMWHGRHISQELRFIGAGPVDWTPTDFRNHARSCLAAHAADLADASRETAVQRLEYRVVDVTDPHSLAGLLEPFADADGVVLYLALPTKLVASTVAVLETLSLPPSLRIVVEKPFGEDLQGAAALNAALQRINPVDSSAFRVDHVLGLPAIAALPSLRTAIPPIPLGAEVFQVSILWEETLALEGRAAFYDRAGALKDLLQNHLLQILCMITLDDASAAAPQSLADRRLQALQAVQIPTIAEAAASSHRARYTGGRLATAGGATGRVVPDYIAEPGVDAGRQTETLAEVVLRVGTTRWVGTRFVLRAGKALAHRRRGILLHFTMGGGGEDVRESWIDVDVPTPVALPDRSDADTQQTGTAPARLEQVAYTRILAALLSGSSELSVSAPETERAWEIFAPFLAAWASDLVPLTEYPAGSSGPVWL